MLASRGQENLVHARPAAGKALLPKTPSAFQTPRTTNRAPLGAKTTNAKAQTIFRDKENAKLQVFKTPAPGQQRIKPDKNSNKPSAARRSGRSKITVASSEPAQVESLKNTVEDDEPDFGYAPPAPIELPDPPMEFGYDQNFPQFRPENMFRGYGQIYDSSPKDENGFSLRLKKEEEEYSKYQEQQEKELLRRIEEQMSKPLVISDDEFEIPPRKVLESKPDTVRARHAATALSSMRLPSVTSKQTASSRSKITQPVQTKPLAKPTKSISLSISKPLSVSKNTIGFPKARRPPSIIPQPVPVDPYHSDIDALDDDLSDFEFSPVDIDDNDDVFQLPVPR